MSFKHFNILVLSLIIAFSFSSKAYSKKNNPKIQDLSNYTELILSSGGDESLTGYILTENLNQTINSGERSSTELFFPNKRKKVFNFILTKLDSTLSRK